MHLFLRHRSCEIEVINIPDIVHISNKLYDNVMNTGYGTVGNHTLKVLIGIIVTCSSIRRICRGYSAIPDLAARRTIRICQIDLCGTNTPVRSEPY